MEAMIMSQTIRIADNKGRITLPGFANATVVLEAISANEYRVRKAEVIPADELRFPEEDMPIVLSKRDALAFVEALENPPAPNTAARRAAKRFKKHHG
jgi:uncharacterized protein (DUF1778 family)